MEYRATSIAAKASVAGSVSRTLRQRVFLFILSKGNFGATINEIVDGTGIMLQTVCARRKELEEKRLVIDSARRRPTPSGRSAIVWVIPERLAARAKLKFKE
jgi:hypothetical protein